MLESDPSWPHKAHLLPAGTSSSTPYFAAIFTVLNLHHYFMDFVIWRRDNAETRYLRSRS